VVVTGASSGIGRACVLHLASLGFAVFAGVRKPEDAERLRTLSNGSVTSVMLDVTEAEQIASAVEEVARTLGGGRLAGVVNNAGIAVAGPLEFLPVEELRRQLEVNSVAPVAVTQAFLPMLRTSKGRVVHVGSAGGLISTPFLGAYSASKFALEAIADSMRMELRPWSIHVSLVDPGSIATEIWERSTNQADRLLEQMPPEFDRLYGAAIPKIKEAARKTERRGRPPMAVAKVVARALTDARPKARYYVGPDAKAQAALARLLPSRWKDRLIVKVAGL